MRDGRLPKVVRREATYTDGSHRLSRRCLGDRRLFGFRLLSLHDRELAGCRRWLDQHVLACCCESQGSRIGALWRRNARCPGQTNLPVPPVLIWAYLGWTRPARPGKGPLTYDRSLATL